VNDLSPIPVVSDAARARFPYPGFVGCTLEEVWALRVEFDRTNGPVLGGLPGLTEAEAEAFTVAIDAQRGNDYDK